MLRAAVLATTLAGTTLLLAVPAQAASSPHASCVGIIVSTLAPAGEFDVSAYKAFSEQEGARNFGAFVSVGASLHLSTFEDCQP